MKGQYGQLVGLPPQGHPSRIWHLPLGADPTESWSWVSTPTPTHEELIKHAERYGTHMVAETMAELGYSLESLTDAIERLDRIDAVRKDKDDHGRVITRRAAKKQSAEKRAKKLLNWEEPTADVESDTDTEVAA